MSFPSHTLFCLKLLFVHYLNHQCNNQLANFSGKRQANSHVKDPTLERSMGTVSKALDLLNILALDQGPKGLTGIATEAGFDKATSRRLLIELAKYGFVEQNLENRNYRLGSAFLHFARIREATLPLTSIVQPILNELAASTGETTHASVLSGHILATIAVAEPQRATRASVDLSEPLPLYATASGLACLAFGPDILFEKYLKQVQFKRIAERTLTSKKALKEKVSETFERGFSRADRSFEGDIIGTAAPIFDQSGAAFGAIAIAAVASRFDAATERSIVRKVLEAALTVSHATGGIAHAHVKDAAGRSKS
jgi:IclR family transcriptional regulator, acetate operon repressor